jgi:hypothetical protein
MVSDASSAPDVFVSNNLLGLDKHGKNPILPIKESWKFKKRDERR